MDLQALYAILVEVARARGQITYSELSERYHTATGDWHEPHGSWDVPLGEINVALHGAGLPALSAVVVLQETREPGGRFWGSSPNVPARPAGMVASIAAYGGILGQVHAANWPATLP
jgi:hypothetical protein